MRFETCADPMSACPPWPSITLVYYIILYCIICFILYYNVLYCIMLHYIVLYYIVLYCTVTARLSISIEAHLLCQSTNAFVWVAGHGDNTGSRGVLLYCVANFQCAEIALRGSRFSGGGLKETHISNPSRLPPPPRLPTGQRGRPV